MAARPGDRPRSGRSLGMTLARDSVSKIVGSETHIGRVSPELVEGSFNVLLGRTLSGKTPLMRPMAGLERPTEGRVRAEAERLHVEELPDRLPSPNCRGRQRVALARVVVRGRVVPVPDRAAGQPGLQAARGNAADARRRVARPSSTPRPSRRRRTFSAEIPWCCLVNGRRLLNEPQQSARRPKELNE